jgi:uncharacterized protein
VDQPCNRTGLRRRDFMRASAVSIAAVAASRTVVPARAQTLPVSGPTYVGAGSNAAIRPFTLNDVTLGAGLLKEKQDRILGFARAYDERRFLVLFNTVAGRPNPPGVPVPGGWEDGGLLSGHWAGHFMTALAQASAGTGEQIFKDKLDWMVDELAACQDALTAKTVHPGYLGAKPEDVVLRLGPPRFAVYGGNQDTNTWAPWYVQHKIVRGFLDAYTLIGNEDALEIAVKMADWAHLALTLGDVTHPDYAGPITRDDLNLMWDTYIAGEYGGANEVVAEIAALTGDAKHLETAKRFDNRESLFGACVEDRDILVCAPGTQPGRKRPARLHANTHVPNFTGYMRIFERTGEAEYRTAASNFFGMVVPHRMYAHGGTSGNYPGSNNNVEMFQNRDNIANSVANDGAETCTTYNLMKLGLENHTKHQESIYFRSADGDTLWVSLFVSSTLSWPERGFTITQETDFPRQPTTKLTVDGRGPLTLRLRVPAWATDGYFVRVNGQFENVRDEPGRYVNLRRRWSPGDTVEITMPFSIRIERARDRPDTQSVFFGPVLLPILGNPGGGSYRELTLYRHLKRDGDYSRAAITPAGGQTFTTHGLTLRPHYVGDSQPHSPYFRRVEPHIVFGSIDTGVPNYKRNDGLPNYDVPVEGIPSPGTDGLTFLDIVWDQAPFKNHGEFASVVEWTAYEFLSAGRFTHSERNRVVRAAERANRELRP